MKRFIKKMHDLFVQGIIVYKINWCQVEISVKITKNMWRGGRRFVNINNEAHFAHYKTGKLQTLKNLIYIA